MFSQSWCIGSSLPSFCWHCSSANGIDDKTWFGGTFHFFFPFECTLGRYIVAYIWCTRASTFRFGIAVTPLRKAELQRARYLALSSIFPGTAIQCYQEWWQFSAGF
uniref:Uncharacterized protein n=1 Tax=Ixodes scapularis TaxID=6945 RepID=A0A4D5REK8_IXOSC